MNFSDSAYSSIALSNFSPAFLLNNKSSIYGVKNAALTECIEDVSTLKKVDLILLAYDVEKDHSLFEARQIKNCHPTIPIIIVLN